jgi:N-acetylneuraminic acid mutarotase
MKGVTILLFSMLSNAVSCLQQKPVSKIDWNIVGNVPASPGQPSPLGFAGAVIGVHERMLLVGGGANFPDSMPWMGGMKKYYDKIYAYTKDSEKLVRHEKVFKLSMNLAYAACCSTSHGIFYGGGENENGLSNKASLLQWDPKTQTILFESLPDLPVAVTNAAATVHGNVVYFAGGETTTGASTLFFSLDLNNSSTGWTTLPDVPKPVSHFVFIAQFNGNDTSIYLAGGRKKKLKGISDFYASLLEFDLKGMKWKEKKPLPYPLCAGTGVAAGSNHILLFGGDRGETFQKIETIIGAIDSETNDSIKQKLIETKSKLQASHPGFSREVLLYNTMTNEWTTIGNIPFDAPVTTTAVKREDVVLIPTGEIRAGVRTPKILSGKIK